MYNTPVQLLLDKVKYRPQKAHIQFKRNILFRKIKINEDIPLTSRGGIGF
jgi:hypothetical protein